MQGYPPQNPPPGYAPQAPPQPPPKKGMSTLAIVLLVIGGLGLLLIGTCAVGAIFVAREASKVLADGGGLVTESPPEVKAELAGARKDYVGAWKSAKGSTLDIEPDGRLAISKDEDGDGMRENVRAPIAAFSGNDIVLKVIVIVTVKVESPPHQIGEHWEMRADGITFRR